MKTFIIGDVHGCAKALNRLIDKLQPDSAEDRLIFLGDLFDRGPNSYEVLQTVKALYRAYRERFVLLRGNHEDYLLQEKLSFMQRIVWERVGRSATVSSFKKHGKAMEDSRPWLKKHCLMYFIGDNFQGAHAGILTEPIEVNDAHTLLHDHDIVLQNRYRGRLTVTGHIALHSAKWFAGDGKTVQSMEYSQWLELPKNGILCIDTGCGKGGRLTGMIIDEGACRLESVPEE